MNIRRGTCILWLGTGIALFFLTSALALISLHRKYQARQLVEHTWHVMNEAASLESAQLSAVASVRGYVLTRRNDQLGEWEAALRDLPRHVERLQALTADNPAQHARVRELDRFILERIELLRVGVDGRAWTLSKEELAARAQMGSQKSEQIRRSLGEFKSEELRLLRVREEALAYQTTVTFSLLGILSLVGITTILLASRTLLRMLSLTQVAHEEARTKALALEVAEADLQALNQQLRSQALHLEAANKELEAFSYSVSHDLRAPLRAIHGFAEILSEDHAKALPTEGERLLGVIRKNASLMSKLIDDLLQFSRLIRTKAKDELVDMEAIVASVWRELQGDALGGRVAFRSGPLPRVRGDSALLRQVFINLLSNALKFSSKKPAPSVEVGAYSEAEEIIFFVRDNGDGFDSQYADKLFKVFQRLHHSSEFPGTGVGLALVERIVTRLGGRVWAQSTQGQGATFYFALPRSAEKLEFEGSGRQNEKEMSEHERASHP